MKNLKKFFFFVSSCENTLPVTALGWNEDRINELLRETPQNPADWVVNLTFQFNHELEKFPREEHNTTRQKNNFLEFGLLSRNDLVFNSTPVPCDFPYSHYNFFSQQYSKVRPTVLFPFFSPTQSNLCVFQNTQFSEVLKDKIISIYQNSWPSQYFKLSAQETNEGHVTFYEPNKNGKTIQYTHPSENNRFKIEVCMPEKNRLYFLPFQHWIDMNTKSFYAVETLSHVKHAMIVKGFNYTKSPYYEAPFTVCFKNNPSNVGSNYLIYNAQLIPNSFTIILGLLSYDDDQDKFISMFQTKNILPYHNFQTLNNMLEFVIKDANQSIVEFSDASLLILGLTIN